MTNIWRNNILGMLIILTLSACFSAPPPPRLTPFPPFSCDSFTESYWQEFTFGFNPIQGVDEVVAKIVELWDVDRSQIQFETEGKSVGIYWQVVFPDGSDPRYTAYFHEDLKLTSIFFQWWAREPTLSQVINCLGVPERIASYYEWGTEKRQLNVDLWYVNKGFVVQGFSFHGQNHPPDIGPEYRMSHFTATMPGDLDRMLKTMYDLKPSVLAGFLCVIKPWPGTIEAIEIESLVGSDSRCAFTQR